MATMASTGGPGVVYVKYADAKRVGYPVDPAVTPFKTPPHEANTWQEEMSPHTDLFRGVQMWWEQPDGTKFTRALVPKWDEDHRGLRVLWKQERFPFIDGPRGVGWTSTYTGGQVDSRGNFIFVEAGGPLRVMKPDGELVTIAGWRVKPGKDPIWLGHPVDVVRRNMELRGTWGSGQYPNGSGFRTPLDVAIDPTNDRTYYVAGYEDQCIWKVVASADWSTATVSVFAGDPSHSKGFADGTGLAARFNGPASLVFDPVCDCLYVADQDNDAIRRISRAGVVTTLAGRPGSRTAVAAGVRFLDQYTYQKENRDVARYAVTAAEAKAGIRPDIYLPQTVRVDSRGQLLVLEHRVREYPPNQSDDARDDTPRECDAEVISPAGRRTTKAARAAGHGSTSTAGATPGRLTASTTEPFRRRGSTERRRRITRTKRTGTARPRAAPATGFSMTGIRTRTAGGRLGRPIRRTISGRRRLIPAERSTLPAAASTA